jgi:hypothetical protein
VANFGELRTTGEVQAQSAFPQSNRPGAAVPWATVAGIYEEAGEV